jgi:hypothetical protein
VALRYACSRPQFGEKRVIEYLTHQSRLLPALANTYALQLAQRTLKVGNTSLVCCCCASNLASQLRKRDPMLTQGSLGCFGRIPLRGVLDPVSAHLHSLCGCLGGSLPSCVYL